MADNNIKKNIAKNLVRYRNTAGLTQSELAEKINYSDKSVSKWERAEGTPDIFELYELSKIYGVRVDDFLISDEDKLPEIKNFSLIKRKRLIAVFVTFVVMVWISAYALAYKPCFEVVNTLISLFLFQGCFSFVLPFSPLSQ